MADEANILSTYDSYTTLGQLLMFKESGDRCMIRMVRGFRDPRWGSYVLFMSVGFAEPSKFRIIHGHMLE